MKKSEITVSMPMPTYEELEGYRERFWNLRDKIKNCLKPSKSNGIDYTFNVDETLAVIKEILVIPSSVNIDITRS